MWVATRVGYMDTLSVQVPPLDAGAAIDAILSNGLGEIITFLLLLGVMVLLIGFMVLLLAAGLSYISLDTSGQRQAQDYLVAAGLVLVIAIIVGSAPEVLQALGFNQADYFSAVDVFGG
jgi:uncharacterized membrane protein